jgi:hypothetical protein
VSHALAAEHQAAATFLIINGTATPSTPASPLAPSPAAVIASNTTGANDDAAMQPDGVAPAEAPTALGQQLAAGIWQARPPEEVVALIVNCWDQAQASAAAQLYNCGLVSAKELARFCSRAGWMASVSQHGRSHPGARASTQLRQRCPPCVPAG